jgi:hypothetical protein
MGTSGIRVLLMQKREPLNRDAPSRLCTISFVIDFFQKPQIMDIVGPEILTAMVCDVMWSDNSPQKIVLFVHKAVTRHQHSSLRQ